MGVVVVVVSRFRVSNGLAVGFTEIELGVVPVMGVTVVVVAGGVKSKERRSEVGEAKSEVGEASRAEGASKVVVAARRKDGNDWANIGTGERGLGMNLLLEIAKGFISRHWKSANG